MKTPLCLLLLGTVLLSACATPLERCQNRASREYRSVRALLETSEANLARGYAWKSEEITLTRWVPCGPPPDAADPDKPRRAPRLCLEEDSMTRRYREAIDPAAETRIRDNLRAKLARLTPDTREAMAACAAAFPPEDEGESEGA